MIGKERIPGYKQMSINDKTLEYLDMNEVYIPLVSYKNYNCKPTVIKGDKVLVGSVVGKRGDDIKIPIHSSVSGKVLRIEEMYHLSGNQVKCIVIENDKLYEEVPIKKESIDINKYTKEELTEILRKCGIVGMGGSGFPTYLKYNPKEKYNTLLVNAVECEPFITTDYAIISRYPNQIIEVLVALKNILNLDKIVIAIKRHNDLISLLEEYTKNYKFIKIKKVSNYYPAGWERDLVKKVLHKKYNSFPGEKGIIVNNVGTIYSMYDALKYEKPLVKRLVTITGEKIKEPMNLMVRTGTLMSEVVDFCGGYTGRGDVRLVAGGPLTGKSLSSDKLVMSKNFQCLLVKNTEKETDTVCMKCGKCSEVCPVKLSPVLIKGNNKISEVKKLHPEKCIECGLCSYICPANLELRDQVLSARDKIKQVEK